MEGRGVGEGEFGTLVDGERGAEDDRVVGGRLEAAVGCAGVVDALESEGT